MKKFMDLYKKVGGTEILRQYLQGHNLLYSMIMVLLLGYNIKSLEILRLVMKNKLLKKLRKQYSGLISEFKKHEYIDIQYKENISRKVWICWLQGMEKAPVVVQKCYQSIKENITDREIVLITEKNYRKYVQFPSNIQKKIDENIISKTHMSDLLRLELLIRYGGTWVDSTIFFTEKPYSYMMDSELFLFQNMKPGLDGHCTSISSWFITAKQGNVILSLVLTMLYNYWNKNNKLVDYYLIHDFFQLAIETYPEEWRKVMPFNNATPHTLLLRLFDQYDDAVWEAVKRQTPLHKLSYKFDDGKKIIKNTYFDKIL